MDKKSISFTSCRQKISEVLFYCTVTGITWFAVLT